MLLKATSNITCARLVTTDFAKQIRHKKKVRAKILCLLLCAPPKIKFNVICHPFRLKLSLGLSKNQNYQTKLKGTIEKYVQK